MFVWFFIYLQFVWSPYCLFASLPSWKRLSCISKKPDIIYQNQMWEFIKENKKVRKQERDQESDQENKNRKKENSLPTKKATKKEKTFFFLMVFLSRACFLSFFLTFLFSLINSHLRSVCLYVRIVLPVKCFEDRQAVSEPTRYSWTYKRTDGQGYR